MAASWSRWMTGLLARLALQTELLEIPAEDERLPLTRVRNSGAARALSLRAADRTDH